jgi:hypothetical protein
VDGSVAPNSVDDFNIIFAPSSSGLKSATITITSDDADENPYTFQVSGEARAPEIAVFGGPGFAEEILHPDDTPRVEDGTLFPTTKIGEGFDHTFRIVNLQDSDGVPLT